MPNRKNNRGALFLVPNKTNPDQPDMTGDATIEGVDVDLAGWFLKTKKGMLYISLSFSKRTNDNKNLSPSDDIPY